MHLTRLALDPRSAQARRDLADPYELHRTLVRAFVEDDASKPARFLWRLEPSGAWGDPIVLVQSNESADWSPLAALPGYLKRPAETKEISEQKLVVADGRYRFRLLANPTVSREGKRYGLAGEGEQLAWLARQGERHGFQVDAALVTSSDVLSSRKGGMQISVQRACFEGVLRVADAAVLARALTAGIGPAKAFGCGLLSLGRG